MAQPSLRRELEFTHTTALVIANMIGTGIFTTPDFWQVIWDVPLWF